MKMLVPPQPPSFPTMTHGKALLVEPGYPKGIPPIGLLKISSHLKRTGNTVRLVRGREEINFEPDAIFITSSFTFYWRDVVDDALHYMGLFPRAKVFVGGIYASLMPEHIEKHIGVRPLVGSFEEIDECSPDYSLLPEEEFRGISHIFTSRGCPNTCAFCGTKAIEPEMRVIKGWKDHLHPSWPNAVIHDNNILSQGDEHLQDVLSYMKGRGVRFFFDNGLDCRLFTKDHALALAKSSVSEVRFAFDGLNQDGAVQEAIGICRKSGIPGWKIKVFILYNFEDDIDEAVYRAMEVHRLGAKPWAMRYMPLRWLNPGRQHVGPKWSPDELVLFNSFINKYGFKRYTFQEWVEKRGRPMRKGDLQGRPKHGRSVEEARSRAIEQNDSESLLLDPRFLDGYFERD